MTAAGPKSVQPPSPAAKNQVAAKKNSPSPRLSHGDGLPLVCGCLVFARRLEQHDMPTVIVYNVKRYDIHTDETIILPRMATREGARAFGGEIIEGTGVAIDENRLERGEQFTPPDFEP